MIQYGEVHEIIQIKNLIWLRYLTTTEEKLTWRRSLIHWKFEVATYIISSMFLDDIQNGSTSCWNNGLVVWSSKEAFLEITQKQWTTKSRLPIRSTWKEIFFTKRNSSLDMVLTHNPSKVFEVPNKTTTSRWMNWHDDHVLLQHLRKILEEQSINKHSMFGHAGKINCWRWHQVVKTGSRPQLSTITSK